MRAEDFETKLIFMIIDDNTQEIQVAMDNAGRLFLGEGITPDEAAVMFFRKLRSLVSIFTGPTLYP